MMGGKGTSEREQGGNVEISVEGSAIRTKYINVYYKNTIINPLLYILT